MILGLGWVGWIGMGQNFSEKCCFVDFPCLEWDFLVWWICFLLLLSACFGVGTGWFGTSGVWFEWLCFGSGVWFSCVLGIVCDFGWVWLVLLF